MKNNCWALIAASGSGERLGLNEPKQYARLLGKPLLRYSAELFCHHAEIDEVMIVTQDPHKTSEMLADLNVQVCQGGASRSDSVLLGLKAIARKDCSNPLVLVHDAARPCLHIDDLNACIRELSKELDQPLILASKASDSLKKSTGEIIAESIERDSVWYAQTPQCARLAVLLKAILEYPDYPATDEAGYLERLGCRVRLLEAQHANIKVTWADDLLIAGALLQNRLERK